MLSPKPWKPEATLRLLLSLFICVYAGSLAVTALHFARSSLKTAWIFYPVLAGALLSLGIALFLLRKRWQIENFLRRFLLLMVWLYAGLILGFWAQKLAGADTGPSVTQMLIAALSFQGGTLFLTARFLREHQARWSEAFGFFNQWRRALLLGIIIACIFLPIGWGLQWVSANVILPAFRIKAETQLPIQTLQIATSWGDRVALGLVTVLLAPIAEELLFRGILYTWIKQFFPRLAIWVSSLLFAAIHLNAMTFVPLFALALLLVLLYERTDNLLAPISSHALFNTFNFVVLYLVQKQMS